METLLTACSTATPPPDTRHTWLQEPVQLIDALGWAPAIYNNVKGYANEIEGARFPFPPNMAGKHSKQ